MWKLRSFNKTWGQVFPCHTKTCGPRKTWCHAKNIGELKIKDHQKFLDATDELFDIILQRIQDGKTWGHGKHGVFPCHIPPKQRIKKERGAVTKENYSHLAPTLMLID